MSLRSRRWIWSLLGLGLLVGILALYVWLLPKPPPGRLVLRTLPSGVLAAIDGQPYGAIPDTGLVALFAEADHHFLELSKTGYETDTSTVWIGLDEVLELEVVMRVPGMAFVRGGTFQMGTDRGDYNEKPAHPVSLAPFYIDLTEVTVGAFRQFRPDYRPPFSGTAMPAVNVSWETAGDYCRFAGKRLPTEAEWERACRGMQGRLYSYGKTYDPDRARTGQKMDAGPLVVRAFPPGQGGIYGMAGNVWEWCADWYGRDYYRESPKENPRGPGRGVQRVLRGGAWYSNARYSRCTHRPGDVKKVRDVSFGFRCVRDLH